MAVCECGCGKQTRLAPQTHLAKGWVKGAPFRFVHGHHQTRNHFRHGIDWIEEDRGYKSACWIWQHGLDARGYGKLKRSGKTHRAHRYVYELLREPIGDFVLDHLCRVTSCVNPDHLDPVSVAENTRRGRARKLSDTQIAEIRHLASTGNLNADVLATEWGVWPHTIRNVARGYTWSSRVAARRSQARGPS